ncbi:uncharacterized protein FA14DRAFT_186882 [Meira miltonrushii]|uniref:R3H domain-containing protein n=1 Tax=Meira miltonrushii TaxID=1280837 RepID=A0A316VGI6_9BASI|nr:uncharacterized protein FA14DRAFT_186882 [Meira miltonrushii]PWN36702.1 hypothetical protein FA14DRAFT_186882 [Meira miltonrushii]
MATNNSGFALSATSKPFIPPQIGSNISSSGSTLPKNEHDGKNREDNNTNGSTANKSSTSSRGRGSNRGRGRGTGRGRGGASNVAGREGSGESSKVNAAKEDGTKHNSSNTTASNVQNGQAKNANRNGKGKANDEDDTGKRKGGKPNGKTEEATQRKGGNQKQGRKFAGKLTSKADEIEDENAVDKLQITQLAIETSDLRSRLVLELSTGQYDCAICYSCVTTKSAIWSCQQCHSVLHLPCVKKWALSSVEKVEAQNAMQDDASMRSRKGTWRCPGCQLSHTREQIPSIYKCWDGRVIEPQGGKGIPPHSCGKPCAKGKCMHGCAAGVCHPGPCPPCPITVTKGCFCGSQKVSLRCSQMQSSPTSEPTGVSCGKTCGKQLACGQHPCDRICHSGPCGQCEEDVLSKCYCGRKEKQMKCGSGDVKQSTTEDGIEWKGRWRCESECDRLFDCEIHHCKKQCHVQEQAPSPCPFSPLFIQSCPCGAEQLNANRSSCQDEVKTCSNTCGKSLVCGHQCSSKCHLGACPPCTVPVVTPCRCGETKKQLTCHEKQREEAEGGQEILCQTVCRSVRLCGKHECRRRCCPLYFQAKNKSKRKPTYDELLEQDPAGYHTCDHTCGKLLSCGLHRCENACHRGQCPPCLQASFDEISCHCGRTVLEPPVPCSTRVQCHFPCARPPPECNHPQVSHDCHGDDESCPPCIFLVDKACMCGKNVVSNVPCHRSRVSCGQTCNTVLPCGFHRCSSLCHEQGNCGPCQQMCGKPRKCGHPCLDACHAPAACSEAESCPAWVTLLCACGNIQQRVRCGSSLHNPVEPDRTLQCTDACLLAQRNAKLAEAFGLSTAQHQARQQPSEYPMSTLTFYGTNSTIRKWCEEIENTLTELIRSNRHAIILQPTNATQRQFMHDLANVFRLQSEDVDEEPRRSVAIRRSINAHVPTPTLSEAYRQHQETLARLRPTALGPLKRGPANSGKSTPGTVTPTGGNAWGTSSEQQMNALMLRGVFGIDEKSLTETIRKMAGVPIHVRWMNEEDVIVLISNTSTAKLHVLRNDIRNVALLNDGSSRLASDVTVCLCDERGKVLRFDSNSGQDHSASSASRGILNRNGSASAAWSATTTSKPTRPMGSGWAAVAATAPAAQSPRPKASAWGTAAPIPSISSASMDRPSSINPPTTSAAVEPERVDTAIVPEAWDDTSLS